MIEASKLLWINDTLLGTAGGVEVNLGLPSRNALHEHILDIFKSLSGCLREHEESVYCHGCAEDTEDDVDLPLNVDKSGRHKVGQSKVLRRQSAYVMSKLMSVDLRRSSWKK